MCRPPPPPPTLVIPLLLLLIKIAAAVPPAVRTSGSPASALREAATPVSRTAFTSSAPKASTLSMQSYSNPYSVPNTAASFMLQSAPKVDVLSMPQDLVPSAPPPSPKVSNPSMPNNSVPEVPSPTTSAPPFPTLSSTDIPSMPSTSWPNLPSSISYNLPRLPMPRLPQAYYPSIPKPPVPSDQKPPATALAPPIASSRSSPVPESPSSVQPPVGPAAFEPPPPPGTAFPIGPGITEPAPPGTASPAGPNPEPTPPGISRQRRAADSKKSASTGKKSAYEDVKKPPPPRVSPSSEKNAAADVSPPAEVRMPHDVEIVPGYSAPPGYKVSTESGEKGSPDIPAQTPTTAGVPPPEELPDVTAGGHTTEHVNYEGLYYTTFAENNTHQEIRTPLEELATASHSCQVIRSVPNHVRRQLGLSHFYQRYTEAYGIPVLSSSRVPDAALRRACYILRFLFADVRTVRDSYRQRRGRVAVIGRNERTTQIPEHSSLGPAWDSRARGLGATDAAPVCTIGEENLLNYGYPADRWYSEDIGLHEFAHGMHLLGARYAMPAWEGRLKTAYNAARRRGLWTNTYAATNHIEYFAEGVQKYHNVEAYSRYPNGIHNHVDTRAKLQQYDPALFQLVAEMFPCGNRYISRRENGFKVASDASQLKLEFPSCRLDGSTTRKPNKPKPTGRPHPEFTTRFRETPTSRATTPTPSEAPCQDNNRYCASWAGSGYCFSNAAYMSVSCRRSCRACGKCSDRHTRCAEWAGRGECKSNPGYMLYNCRRSCRAC